MAILRGLFWHASFVFGTIASDCILPAMSNSSENPHKYYFFQVLYWLHLWLAFCLELTVYPLVNIRNGLFLTCLLMKILLPIVSTAVPPLYVFFCLLLVSYIRFLSFSQRNLNICHVRFRLKPPRWCFVSQIVAGAARFVVLSTEEL